MLDAEDLANLEVKEQKDGKTMVNKLLQKINHAEVDANQKNDAEATVLV